RWHCVEERVRRLVPQGVRGPLFGTLGRLYPKFDRLPRLFRAKATLQELARDPVCAYFSSVSISSETLRARLFSSALRRDIQGYRAVDLLHQHMSRSGS